MGNKSYSVSPELMHYAPGQRAQNHKYIAIKNGKYIYPDDRTSSKSTGKRIVGFEGDTPIYGYQRYEDPKVQERARRLGGIRDKDYNIPGTGVYKKGKVKTKRPVGSNTDIRDAILWSKRKEKEERRKAMLKAGSQRHDTNKNRANTMGRVGEKVAQAHRHNKAIRKTDRYLKKVFPNYNPNSNDSATALYRHVYYSKNKNHLDANVLRRNIKKKQFERDLQNKKANIEQKAKGYVDKSKKTYKVASGHVKDAYKVTSNKASAGAREAKAIGAGAKAAVVSIKSDSKNLKTAAKNSAKVIKEDSKWAAGVINSEKSLKGKAQHVKGIYEENYNRTRAGHAIKEYNKRREKGYKTSRVEAYRTKDGSLHRSRTMEKDDGSVMTVENRPDRLFSQSVSYKREGRYPEYTYRQRGAAELAGARAIKKAKKAYKDSKKSRR